MQDAAWSQAADAARRHRYRVDLIAGAGPMEHDRQLPALAIAFVGGVGFR